MIARDEARRYAQLLRQVLELSGVSEREVERRLALGGGTLSRIFGGRIELKLSHLLAILAVAGVKPERFFQLAAVVLEGAAEESLGRQVLAALDRLAGPGVAPAGGGVAAGEPAAALGLLADDEIDRRIDAALARLGIGPGRTAAAPRPSRAPRAVPPPSAVPKPRTAGAQPPRPPRPARPARPPRPAARPKPPSPPKPAKLAAARPPPRPPRPKPPQSRPRH
jgi:transcriptional regulator with XRE-family HTH domain